MSDRDDFSAPSDDYYNDALDDNFEFDDVDYEDVDLDLDEGSDDFEVDYDEDDWEDGSVEQGQVASAPKKQFKLDFNTIVIIGAVVVGGIVMMSTMSSSKKQMNESKPPAAEKIATHLSMEGSFEGIGGMDQDADAMVQSLDKKKGIGFKFDMDDPQAVIEDVPPMPVPIISEVEDPVEEIGTPLVEKDTVALKDDPQIPELSVPLEEERVSDVVLEQEKEVIANVKLEPIPEPVVKADVPLPIAQQEKTQNIAALEEKLDAILQRLDGVEEKMKNLQNIDVSKVEAELEILKKDIRQAPKAAESTVKPKPVEVTQPQPKKKTTYKRAAKRPVVKKPSWELRAAQPGKAWVSRKGSQKMTPIIVGDVLSGIGKIQSITYVNGGWIVAGTTGKIKQ